MHHRTDPRRLPPLPSGVAAELEALDWLGAARGLIDVLAAGHWEPEPFVLEHLALLVARAAYWYEAAGWTEGSDRADDERRAA